MGGTKEEGNVWLVVSCGTRPLWAGKTSGRGSELPDGNVCESSEPAETTETGRPCVTGTFFGRLGAGFRVSLGVGRGLELGTEVNAGWGGPRLALDTLLVAVQGQTIDTSLMNREAASAVAKSIWKRR